MRFREFLLEYDRDKTLKTWWVKLAERIIGDRSIRSPAAISLSRDHLRPLRHELMGERAMSLQAGVMGELEQFDPSPNKEYVLWIVQRYCNSGINLWEDMPRVLGYLHLFDDAKKSGYFRRTPEHAAMADIGRFKTLSDLGQFIKSLPGDALKSKNQQDADLGKDMIASGDAVILYDDAQIKIVSPRTWEAAKYFGRNTQWCTATRDSSTTFEFYAAQGPLYVVIDKKKNKRWQFHFESAQFMDEEDEEISNWNELPATIFSHFDVERLGVLAKIGILRAETFTNAPSAMTTRLLKTVVKSCDRRTLAIASAVSMTPYLGAIKPTVRKIELMTSVGKMSEFGNDLENFITWAVHSLENYWELMTNTAEAEAYPIAAIWEEVTDGTSIDKINAVFSSVVSCTGVEDDHQNTYAVLIGWGGGRLSGTIIHGNTLMVDTYSDEELADIKRGNYPFRTDDDFGDGPVIDRLEADALRVLRSILDGIDLDGEIPDESA